jgi:hypothetical protein
LNGYTGSTAPGYTGYSQIILNNTGLYIYTLSLNIQTDTGYNGSITFNDITYSLPKNTTHPIDITYYVNNISATPTTLELTFLTHAAVIKPGTMLIIYYIP